MGMWPLSQINDHHYILALHPRFKASWIESEDKRAEIWELIRMEINKLTGQDAPEFEATTSSVSHKKGRSGAAGDLNYFYPTEEASGTRQLEAYISQPRGDLLDMKRFPIIHKLFRKFNTLMPSSATVER